MPQDPTGTKNTGINIRLFGEFFIRTEAAKSNPFKAIRHQALIAYLALHAPLPVPRSEVAFQLWVDSSEEQALTNLRKALHQIRQILPDVDLIVSDTHFIQLDLAQITHLDISDFKSNIAAAEEARRAGKKDAEQSALEAAIATYSGELLPQCYDEWIIPEREQYRDSFIRAADRLVVLQEARKHYRDAIKTAQQLLLADRLREETYRSLIRLHALNNDRAAALNVYHICASRLAKELGVEPDATIQEMHERLLKNEFRLSRTTVPATQITLPLVSRQQEWNDLIAKWKEASRGKLHFTLLSGEAGIGKTRLAEELIQWAAHQGIHTLSSICYPADSQISYAPVTGWLRSATLDHLDPRWRRELARLIPELHDELQSQPMTENWQKQVFFEAMAQALLSQPQPLLLFLDDIQWCDADSLEWLRYFMRFDKKASLFVLATLRVEEVPSNPGLQNLLLDLRTANQFSEIELTRFSKEQTGALAARLFKNPLSDSDINTLFEESEGVPLFVVEIARERPALDQVQTQDLFIRKQEALTPRLRAILEGKLVRLSAPARAVAESAAILGREFNLSLLKKISELEEGTTMAALDELWQRRMVRVRGGDMYDFSHDKLREATLDGLSPIRSAWLNQRAAEALELDGNRDSYVRIANHLERAALFEKSTEYYVHAANHARELFAFGEALEHLKKAIQLERRTEGLSGLHEQHGDVLRMLGLREDAIQAFFRAFNLADDHLQKARLARKQIDLFSRFDIGSARKQYETALAEIDLAQHDPGYWHEWIVIKFAWIQACYWQQDMDGQDELLTQLKDRVKQYGTPTHMITYHHHLINSMFVRGRYVLQNEHVILAKENIDRAVATGDSHQISLSKQQFGMVAYAAEQFEISESTFCETIELSEKNGDSNSLLIARVYLSLVHRRLKNLDAVRSDTRSLYILLQNISKNPQYEAVAEANTAWLAYCEGKKEAALHHAQAAIDLWKTLTSTYPAQWAALMVLFALAVDAKNTEDAHTYARYSLDPAQQRLQAVVESALRRALEANQPAGSHNLPLFASALEKAKSAGYV